ncbi:MAG: cytochrome P450 [Solirubrobacterales bacterium]|nr:cytochrome P450 [Solirubrobacterales bacterium]MCB0860920.1 cytochrome P450 [Solirubrobacterales bacterium]HRV59216.1 cytochrome P450 [Solirubrobacterales bacterium]
MTLVTELDLPELDPADPELRGDRWHVAANGLLDSGKWVAQGPLSLIIVEREAGEFFLRSKSTEFPGKLIGDLFGVTDGPLREEIDANIINTNGDVHRRLRSLVNPALTPRAANGWRPVMREILEGLWDELETDEFDFVSRFSRPYPSQTIARVMGAPAVDAQRLHDWSEWIQRQFDPIALSDPETVQAIQDKVAEFYAWVDPMIEDRRGNPADDLITTLIRTEEEGEKLSDQELRNLVLNILVGGVDTTQSQLSHAIRLLAGKPEQWQALRENPDELVPRAVSEVLRFEPITAFTARQVTEEVEYRDVTFPAGTLMVICSFTGNRDPEAFEDAREFDILIERDRTRPLTFGAGIHYCVGANLARAELEEGLRFLAERVETFELNGLTELQAVSGIYGIDRMDVRIVPDRL